MMRDKTVVITGGTGGIGQQTAIGLAKLGAQVVITGRSEERGQAGREAVVAASGSRQVEFVQGDLSSTGGVIALADSLIERYPRIDVLINNAGHMAPERIINADGFESGFAVNVVAPLLLTRRLLPALRKGASSRVVNLTGGDAGSLDPSNLQCEKSFDGLNSYNHSKRALEAMSMALSRELQPQGVTVNVVYPGQASTSMTQSVKAGHLPWWMRPLFPLFKLMVRPDGGKSARKASRSSVWAASEPSLAGVSGKYFDKNCHPAEFHDSVNERLNQEQVLAAASMGSGAPA